MKKAFKKRILAAGLSISMVVSMSGCTGGKKENSEADVPVVTIWGNGGQEVRDALQKIADMHNADPNYNKIAKVEIQFVVSGTSEQSLPDRLAAAYKAGETDTDFDLIALDDSGVSTILAQTSEDFFEPIDTSRIPNYDNLVYKENVVGDTFIPYRGTAVFLAYNSDVVADPPKTAEKLYQWIKENPGRFAYCDPSTGGSGYSFTANSVYNQLPAEAATSSDRTWLTGHTEEWDKGGSLR